MGTVLFADLFPETQRARVWQRAVEATANPHTPPRPAYDLVRELGGMPQLVDWAALEDHRHFQKGMLEKALKHRQERARERRGDDTSMDRGLREFVNLDWCEPNRTELTELLPTDLNGGPE